MGVTGVEVQYMKLLHVITLMVNRGDSDSNRLCVIIGGVLPITTDEAAEKWIPDEGDCMSSAL